MGFILLLFPTLSLRYLLIIQCKTILESVLLAAETAEGRTWRAEVSEHILMDH